MSDTLDATRSDGGPVSSDPGYAAWLGKIQYDAGTALINNVDPSQTAGDKVMFTKHIPAGAKVVLKTVERTASL